LLWADLKARPFLAKKSCDLFIAKADYQTSFLIGGSRDKIKLSEIIAG
jgi:hypothetical protein